MKKDFKYTIDGTEYEVSIKEVEGQNVKLEVNGKLYTAVLPEQEKPAKPTLKAQNVEAKPASAPQVPTSGGAAIKAPLPGVIIDILVKTGDAVKKGQKVAVLEAMKMENAIEADRDGVIAEVKVKKGDSIMEGSDILTIA